MGRDHLPPALTELLQFSVNFSAFLSKDIPMLSTAQSVPADMELKDIHRILTVTLMHYKDELVFVFKMRELQRYG